MLAELMRLKLRHRGRGDARQRRQRRAWWRRCLAGGGLDPTVVVGGRTCGCAGVECPAGQRRRYLVAEADESDRSFFEAERRCWAIVTNLDREHMDCYRDMSGCGGGVCGVHGPDAVLRGDDRVPWTTLCCVVILGQVRAAGLHLWRRAMEADFQHARCCRRDRAD